ncbi:MAG: sigma 54-interacting transcriptional regulator [Desulfomonile tiedjei]|uniref:Sigma 54-interacting transcriptional regulator n=1 Tax=Desulfomonile tiedjei TaxID=2358 RepID=A0A9D6V7V8_9BACT|nr:sigma 54-interacting transcriptional regulator [Desulfomonile tiedjei]
MNVKSLKVLLVEDNPVDAEFLQEELAQNNSHFKIYHVDTLGQAVKALPGREFDVMLLDLGLPDSRGIDTFLRAHSAAPNVPIVVLSGLDDEFLGIEAVGQGAQDYLVKGKTDSSILSRSLNHAVQRQQLLTDRRQAEKALRRSEERFRAVFEAALDCIYIKDRSLRYTHVNPAMERLFEVPTSRFIGRTDEEILGVEVSSYSKEVETRVLQGEFIEDEHTRRIAGVPLTFIEVRVPIRDSANNIIGLAGIARDVTERSKRDFRVSEQQEDYPSPIMQKTLARIRVAADREATILLLGESGSGKDYLARYVHEHSRRVNGPFFAINCAAVAPELAESELFGHERGAFTGAHGRKRGLLELAEGGTLLLNEIGELSLPLQAKLLTFLDTRQFTRVGGEKNISVNARLIAATNRDLEAEVEEGRFRRDLFYRLNVISVVVPALRERKEDIPSIVREIAAQLRHELQLSAEPHIDSSVMASLVSYNWPGNVRELRNVLERALMLSNSTVIETSHLGMDNSARRDWSINVTFPEDRSLNDVTREVKSSLVNEALRRSRGSRQGAARLLGISRYSLKHYMNSLDLGWGDD